MRGNDLQAPALPVGGGGGWHAALALAAALLPGLAPARAADIGARAVVAVVAEAVPAVAPNAAPTGDVTPAVAAFEAGVAGKEPPAVIAAGRGWLKAARNDPAVTPADRARVYDRMLVAARGVPNLRQGNAIAGDILKADRRRYGEAGVERVPGLYLAADWYGYAGRLRDEQRAWQSAIAVLEAAHGPADARLAYPLRRYAGSVLGDCTGPAATTALDRALGLTVGGGRDDVRERAEAFAQRGDHEILCGRAAASAGWYRAAWQKLADSQAFGRSAANAAFREPRPLAIDVPANPFASGRRGADFYAAGRVAFAFTVLPDGRLEDIQLRGFSAPTDAVPAPLEKALRAGRYRPGIVDGTPRATPGHGFEFVFTRDQSLPRRSVRAGPIDQRF